MDYIKKNKMLISYSLLTMVLFVCLRNDYFLYKDSVEYIQMKGYVPPLYPLFLAFFRCIFGESTYLYVVIYVQAFFAAYSIALVTCYITKVFSLNKVCSILCYVGALVPFLIETIRGDEKRMIPHCILTEGIAVSMFYIWVLFALRFLAQKKMKDFYGAIVLTVLLCLTRAQFLVCFIMDFALIVYVSYCYKDLQKRFVKGILSIIIGLLVLQGGEAGYKFATMKTTQSAWNSSYLMTHVMYVSTDDDINKFEEKSLKDIFCIMYQEFDSINYLYDYSGKTWVEKSNHWSENFLKGYWKVGDSIEKYYSDNNLPYDKNIDGPKVVNELIDTLKFNIPKSFLVSLYQLPISITYSIFLLEEGYEKACYIIAHFILLCAIAIMIYRLRQSKNNLDAMFMLFIILRKRTLRHGMNVNRFVKLWEVIWQ